MCIFNRLKRILCYRNNRHKYVMSSNTLNNDSIFEQEMPDLNAPYTNCNNYVYNRNDIPGNILSWNVNEVACFSTPNSRQNISKYLKEWNCDIICLQGLYSEHSRRMIIEDLGDLYQYYLTGDLYKNYHMFEDSGLFILSRYPIKFHKFVHFDNMRFPDTLCNKGVLYVTINNINIALTNLPYYNREYIELAFNTLKSNTPFDEYMVVGCLQKENAHIQFNTEPNNHVYTNNNQTISDYILSLYSYIKLTVNVKLIDIKYISYNYPVLATIKKDFLYNL